MHQFKKMKIHILYDFNIYIYSEVFSPDFYSVRDLLYRRVMKSPYYPICRIIFLLSMLMFAYRYLDLKTWSIIMIQMLQLVLIVNK